MSGGGILALIAGEGGLPPVIASALMARGEVPVVCEMRGFASAVDPKLPRLTFRLETLGTFLATLQEAGVDRVCMAGAMRRPQIEAEAIDARTAPLVPRVMAALAQGDDGTLRAFIALFEEHGMEVVGAADLVPELLPQAGVLTKAQPFDLQVETILARDRLAQMGAEDLGQALVIRGGRVLAQEDDRGTDAMLADLAVIPEAPPSDDGMFGLFDAVGDMIGGAADWLSGQEAEKARLPGAGGVLFKAPKPGQDRRADLPTIGPATIAGAAKAGLAGIVIEAGGVMVLDREAVIADADAAGLFLVVTSLGLAP